ncbi:phosphoenolpyruvate carboxykinase (ATP) [Gammaproteobacteria bacterium]|nr:phosphoenolpyruvate carboxykinase (ATP) [Gammaproteobacteria bacterium]
MAGLERGAYKDVVGAGMIAPPRRSIATDHRSIPFSLSSLSVRLMTHSAPLPAARTIHHNLSTPRLVAAAIRNGEGELCASGSFVARTGARTGRAAKDKFVVRRKSVEDSVWWGPINQPIEPEKFDALHQRLLDHLAEREVYVGDFYAGADPRYRLAVRVINERAWHNLFARNLFIDNAEPGDAPLGEFTVVQAPTFRADPARDGTHGETFILLDFEKRLVLIGGTEYAGEIKKSIFTVMNYLLPEHGVMPMHCSANTDADGNTAVFFGLSGTGKTTLSADATRRLIGDDEHGWSDDGVFNFEGGCYAKAINLSAESEPEIYAAASRFGSVLENVILDPLTHEPDFADVSLTENTRIAYPINFIPNFKPDGCGTAPRSVIFLTCDAFGVLPPVSKLDAEQTAFHFVNGYTAKVAGTEHGITKPTPNFSPCYGGPFLPRTPTFYAEMLKSRVENGATVWLVNTGWSGGAYGVGKRIPLKHTRAIIRAIHDGSIEQAQMTRDAIFAMDRPVHIAGVPDQLLDPRATWDDKADYDAQATDLAERFAANYSQYG